MSKQVRLFLLPDDYPDVQRAIESCGPARYLPDPVPGHAPTTISSLAIAASEMGKTNLTVFIVREQDLPNVKTKFVPGQGYYVVDDLTSPVIEFMRSYFTGSLLRSGRLYHRASGSSEAASAFPKWADAVLAAVKKTLRRVEVGGGVYLSERVITWKESRNAAWHRGGQELVVPEEAQVPSR